MIIFDLDRAPRNAQGLLGLALFNDAIPVNNLVRRVIAQQCDSARNRRDGLAVVRSSHGEDLNPSCG
jgi:hypothetical protein